MKKLSAIAISGFLILYLVQILWYPRRNETAPVLVDLSREQEATLRKSCYDCHSMETRNPWYSVLPVAGLWMTWHIRSGRNELNFNDWNNYSVEKRGKLHKDIADAIQSGVMPPRDYLWMHEEARLTSAELALFPAAGDRKD